MKRFQFFQATRVCSERSKQTKFDGRSEQNDWTAGKTERRRCSRNSGSCVQAEINLSLPKRLF